jgi:hypothetical protein
MYSDNFRNMPAKQSSLLLEVMTSTRFIRFSESKHLCNGSQWLIMESKRLLWELLVAMGSQWLLSPDTMDLFGCY